MWPKQRNPPSVTETKRAKKLVVSFTARPRHGTALYTVENLEKPPTNSSSVWSLLEYCTKHLHAFRRHDHQLVSTLACRFSQLHPTSSWLFKVTPVTLVGTSPSGTLRFYDIIDFHDIIAYFFDIIVYHRQYHMYDIMDMILHMIS